MLAGGGTKDLTYKQVVDAMFPMAVSLNSQTDEEMTVFSGTTHLDNLQAYYKLVRSMLLDPGWREDDFKRIKDDTINSLRVGLRGNNDEELGKEVLYSTLYRGTPYGHYSLGTISAIEKMTLGDLKQFYKQHYTQSNLILGLAGGYPADFLDQIKKDFATLPAKDETPVPAIKPETDRPHARSNRRKEYAIGGVLIRFPDRREAGRSGLSGAAADAIVPGSAPHERRPLVPAHSRDSRDQLRRLCVYRVLSARDVSDGAVSEPGAPQPDFPDLDPAGGTASGRVYAAPGIL